MLCLGSSTLLLGNVHAWPSTTPRKANRLQEAAAAAGHRVSAPCLMPPTSTSPATTTTSSSPTTASVASAACQATVTEVSSTYCQTDSTATAAATTPTATAVSVGSQTDLSLFAQSIHTTCSDSEDQRE